MGDIGAFMLSNCNYIPFAIKNRAFRSLKNFVFFVVAFMAKVFKVLPVQRYIRIFDIVLIQNNFMMHDVP